MGNYCGGSHKKDYSEKPKTEKEGSNTSSVATSQKKLLLSNPQTEVKLEEEKANEVQAANPKPVPVNPKPVYRDEIKVAEWKADFNVGIQFSKVDVKPDYSDKTSNINYEVKFG